MHYVYKYLMTIYNDVGQQDDNIVTIIRICSIRDVTRVLHVAVEHIGTIDKHRVEYY